MNINEFAQDLFSSPIIFTGVGYVYGAIFKTDKTVAMAAFIVHDIACVIVQHTATAVTGGTQTLAVRKSIFNPDGQLDIPVNPKAFTIIKQTGALIISIISLIAFRQLNLIAMWGKLYFTIDAIYRAFLVFKVINS